MRRRIPGMIVVAAATAGVVAVAGDAPAVDIAEYSIAAQGWMPFAPPAGSLTESWFCPGVPATGVDGVEGEIVVANRTDDLLEGTVMVINDAGESRRLALSVDAWTTATLDLDATLPSAIVGAVVEVEGGGALVEQHAIDPDGDSIAPCPNATSDSWYLADGYTVDGSLDRIILANPFEQTVVANLAFATRDGYREPGSYRGLTVAPRSIRVVDLGAPGAGAQSEPVLAVDVDVARGRLVVGRAQSFRGGTRAGSQVTVGSPTPREQWWFADGTKGSGVREEFVIYNPSDEAVEVDVLFVGIDTPPVLVDPILVAAREAVTFNSGSQSLLPDGDHATVFATSNGVASIVVERVTTRTVGEVAGTGVLAGATARQDGFVATTWYVLRAPDEPTERALIVYNVDNSPGTLSVSAVGRSGPVPVDGLEAMEYGAARRIEIDLTDPVVAGRQLVIEASTRIMVERSFPNGVDELRDPSWAIPAG